MTAESPSSGVTGEEAHAIWQTAYEASPHILKDSATVDAWNSLAAEISRRAIQAEFGERSEVHSVPPDMGEEMHAFMVEAEATLAEAQDALTAERAKVERLREVLKALEFETLVACDGTPSARKSTPLRAALENARLALAETSEAG